MNGRSKSWELTLASGADAPGIQKVFDDGDFTGGISVKFSRAPDPYQSFQNDGEHIVVPIATDVESGEVLGVGGCIVRAEYVNGIQQNTGYLTGMKILRSHQGRLHCIKDAYRLIAAQTAQYRPFYYTTILKDNVAAIKLLEKHYQGMPLYTYLGEYTVFCLGSGRKPNLNGYTFVRGHTDALAGFYDEQLPNYNLAPASEKLYQLSEDDFYCLKSPAGDIVAAGAIWNQQSYKQYVISGYNGIYKALSYLPTAAFGYPRMPKAGTAAHYASLAALLVADNDPTIARLFLKCVLYEANSYDFVMLGLFENHPLGSVAQQFKHIKYSSRLYEVDFAPEGTGSPALDQRPIMLEVGLL